MIKLSLIRKIFTEESTIGELFVDGRFFCYTLEDTVRSEKIPGKTAIQAGTYKIVIDFSHRFQVDLPRLLFVPRFDGIRIHAGNKAEDTDGCILIGFKHGNNSIWESKSALIMLMDSLKDKREIEICISNFAEETAENILKGTLNLPRIGVFDVEMRLTKHR